MKKLWILLGSLAVLLILAAVLLFATAKSRVMGTWEADAGYMDTYLEEIVVSYEFREDGTFVQNFHRADGGGIMNVKYGTWTMSGLQVYCHREGNGNSTHFTYDPLSHTLETSRLTYHEVK